MAWRGNQRACRSAFHDAAEIHHRDALREMRHDRDVVGNEQIGEAEFSPQTLQQRQDLRLHRDVECGDRLVADHERRLGDQRASNTDALALPAGELMRVAISGALVSAQPNQAPG